MRKNNRKFMGRLLGAVLSIAMLGTMTLGNIPMTANTDYNVYASGYADWASGTAYVLGDLIGYNGKVYECIYVHTSHVGWLPDSTPTLWKERTDLVYSPEETTAKEEITTKPSTSGGTVVGGGKTKTMMIGYWHTWDNSGNPFIPLRNVDENWDVINISFTEPVSPGSTDGRMKFNISGLSDSYTKDDFKKDIKDLQAKGKKIVLSIGGYEGYFQLGNQAAINQFVGDITSYIDEYGFDGIDIDLEQSSVNFLSGQDPDINNPVSPNLVNMITAIRTILSKYDDDFILSWAPETFYMQMGYTHYAGINSFCDARAGSYLPMINALRDETTFVHVQLYNSIAITASDGVSYSMGNKDAVVAMCKMLLDGFYVGAGVGVAKSESTFFKPIRPDQVVIGVPSSTSAAGSGQIANSELQAAFAELNAEYPGMRGIMSWSINWDSSQNNNSFVRENKAFIAKYSAIDEDNEKETTTEPVAFDAYTTIEAEKFSSKEGGVIDTNSNASGGYNIGGLTNGTTMTYNNVNFSEKAKAITMYYSSPSSQAMGNAEIYVDSLNNKVGTIVLPNNADSWQDYGMITARLDKEIAAGSHTVYVKYVITGSKYYVANVDYFKFVKASEYEEETTTKEVIESPNITISDGIKINGYQISATVEGMRSVYSVDKTINGKDVISSGIVYSLADYASEDELYVGSTNEYVRSFESTNSGICSHNFSDSETATSYAMTMKFSAKSSDEFNAKWRIRAYAELSNGTYVYTNSAEYTIYEVAELLYNGQKMNTIGNHEYLYINILTIVNKDYPTVDYEWNNIIVPIFKN